MKAIVIQPSGEPRLLVQEVPAPTPGFRQVRVRMLAAAMNPSDMLSVEGRYAKPLPPPGIPGFEGVGVVEQSGGGLLGWLRKGKRVALISDSAGTWAEQVVVPAKVCVPVPDSVPDEQAAMFFVNPITAVAMVRHVLRVRPGQLLLQTAAGSALGGIVIRLAKKYGFKTIDVVRRREQIAELKELGSTHPICEADGPIDEQVRAIAKGQGVPHVLDCVGGAAGSAAIRCLGPHGRAIIYGVLSAQTLEVDPRFLITNSKKVEGFWLSDWLKNQSIPTMLKTFRLVKQLMQEGVVQAKVAAVYDMNQIDQAVQHVNGGARGGKIVLRLGNR